MTLAERQLYSALLTFFKSLALNPNTSEYFNRPALTSNGEIVEYNADNPQNTIEFFSLKSAIASSRIIIHDICSFSEALNEENFAVLKAFFIEICQCGASYEPMFAPVYIKSSTIDLGNNLYDAKAIYVALAQLPTSEIAKAVKKNNIVIVKKLFDTMQVFSGLIKNIDSNLLQVHFGNDLNRIQQWKSLPPIHLQVLFWESFTAAFERKKSIYDEIPSLCVGTALAWMHKLSTYVLYNEEERAQLNQGIYFPMIIIPSMLFAFVKMYLQNSHYQQVLSHNKQVEATEQRIIKIGEHYQDMITQPTSEHLVLRSSMRTLLQTANITENSLTEEELRTLGYK